MFTGTSWLYSGSDTSKVSVCGMPMSLPVAVLFSKTSVVGPATAVVGKLAYWSVRELAVHVSVLGRRRTVTVTSVRGRRGEPQHQQQRAQQRGVQAQRSMSHCAAFLARSFAAGVASPPVYVTRHSADWESEVKKPRP